MKLRCKNCSKLLAIGTGILEIKCTRCKSLNQFNTHKQTTECPEHHTSLNKEIYECSQKTTPVNPIQA